MALIGVIKHNSNSDEFIWKYPNEEIGTWSQLVVNPTQEVILVKDGMICDIFKAGKYTLDTENIPILNKIINIPFGGSSPYKVEIWFINKKYNLSIKWGTPTPIQLEDPKYNIFVKIRSYGHFGIKIEDTKIFFMKLIGTNSSFREREINSFFKGLYITKIRDLISSYLIKKRISILEINAYIDELSRHIKENVEGIFREYGIMLVNFFINDISVPDDDISIKRLKEALSKKAEMNIVGYNYVQERSFDTLEGAATNSSNSIGTNLMGAGLGMTMGVGLGNTLSDTMNSQLDIRNYSDKNSQKITCKKCSFVLPGGAKFCPECGSIQIKKCNNCGTIQKDKNAKFCLECGATIIKTCKKCKNKVSEDSKFCSECGEIID